MPCSKENPNQETEDRKWKTMAVTHHCDSSARRAIAYCVTQLSSERFARFNSRGKSTAVHWGLPPPSPWELEYSPSCNPNHCTNPIGTAATSQRPRFQRMPAQRKTPRPWCWSEENQLLKLVPRYKKADGTPRWTTLLKENKKKFNSTRKIADLCKKYNALTGR